jgi:hypothetical protein
MSSVRYELGFISQKTAFFYRNMKYNIQSTQTVSTMTGSVSAGSHSNGTLTFRNKHV